MNPDIIFNISLFSKRDEILKLYNLNNMIKRKLFIYFTSSEHVNFNCKLLGIKILKYYSAQNKYLDFTKLIDLNKKHLNSIKTLEIKDIINIVNNNWNAVPFTTNITSLLNGINYKKINNFDCRYYRYNNWHENEIKIYINDNVIKINIKYGENGSIKNITTYNDVINDETNFCQIMNKLFNEMAQKKICVVFVGDSFSDF